MTLAELSNKVRFVTDPEDDRQAIQLDLSTWEEIVAALEAQYISLTEAAQRARVSQEMMTTWLEKGILPGTQVAGNWLVAVKMFERFAPLERILDELDAERPPLTPEEAAIVVNHGRENWTWVGREQFEPGHGDYTVERQQWLDRYTLDELLAEAKQTESPASPDMENE